MVLKLFRFSRSLLVIKIDCQLQILVQEELSTIVKWSPDVSSKTTMYIWVITFGGWYVTTTNRRNVLPLKFAFVEEDELLMKLTYVLVPIRPLENPWLHWYVGHERSIMHDQLIQWVPQFHHTLLKCFLERKQY